jgi:hypothetical protein
MKETRPASRLFFGDNLKCQLKGTECVQASLQTNQITKTERKAIAEKKEEVL